MVTTEDLSRYQGVRLPRGVDLRHRDVLEEVQRVFINQRVCEGRGGCGPRRTACRCNRSTPSSGGRPRSTRPPETRTSPVSTENAPSFIRVLPGTTPAPRERERHLEAADLPQPVVKVPAVDFNLRITGIGGTGVVTTAQILSTAAVMSGMQVRGLDQMGMAQKGGAVVSDSKLSSAPFVGPTR